jgi:vancomycin permeability regulator SanA
MIQKIKISRDFNFWCFLKQSFIVSIFVAFLIIMSASLYVRLNYDQSFTGHKTCAVVFGAAVWKDDIPSHELYDRTLAGIKLYKNGYIDCLIFSGGKSKYGSHEADVMKKIAINRGVLKEDIHLDYEGINTLNTLLNLQNSMKKSLVFVSNDFHLARISLIAKKLKISDFALHAATYNNGEYFKSNYFFWREVVGVIYYAVFL